MNNVDYLIVGDGFAGLFFAHQLIKNNKSFKIFSEGKKSGSKISAGMVNPIVLKRFTTFWLANEQIQHLHQTLGEIETLTGNNYFIHQPIARILHDETERALWDKKRKADDLKDFLDEEFLTFDSVNNPFGGVKVNQSGRLNVDLFFKDFTNYLKEKAYWVEEKFDYSTLDTQNKTYKDFHFSKIVFAEGIAVEQNPFFNFIPILHNKGHHMVVKLSEPIKDLYTIKKKHFVFHLEGDQYYYGGTYDRESETQELDESAKNELINGLSQFYPKPFEVVKFNYGFRPTVVDRRPIIGEHPNHKDLFVFNGLGARGVLNGCFFSEELYHHIENKKPLRLEIDLQRFNPVFN